jgi:hypothetical protein
MDTIAGGSMWKALDDKDATICLQKKSRLIRHMKVPHDSLLWDPTPPSKMASQTS